MGKGACRDADGASAGDPRRAAIFAQIGMPTDRQYRLTEALGATALHSPYAAAKAGVVGLTRSLAVELGRDGITVNCICPGPVTTGMPARISDEHKASSARRRTALGRYGGPEEVAHMTLSLCLPAASFLTGAIIPADGRLVARTGGR